MNKITRILTILDKLSSQERVCVKELATFFDCNKKTNENNKNSRFLDLAIYSILGVLVFNNHSLIEIANSIWNKIANFLHTI